MILLRFLNIFMFRIPFEKSCLNVIDFCLLYIFDNDSTKQNVHVHVEPLKQKYNYVVNEVNYVRKNNLTIIHFEVKCFMVIKCSK